MPCSVNTSSTTSRNSSKRSTGVAIGNRGSSSAPGIWSAYLNDLETGWAKPVADRAQVVAEGRGGIAVMDAFARELTETGYLHNHARMWFASYWIHIEKLPWQLGAQFFYRHLLDADAASNTLSWRWVAGLQTAGKTYRVRESNLRKYLSAEWLDAHSEGLDQIGNGNDFPAITEEIEKPDAVVPEVRTEVGKLPEKYAVVIHGSDLRVEDSPIAHLKPTVLIAAPDYEPDDSEQKIAYRKATLADGVARAEAHFGCKTVSPEEAGVEHAVMLHAPVGSALDLPFKIIQITRPEDAELFPLATSGFFKFWKGTKKNLEGRS